MKKTFFTEAAFFAGIILLAIGTALMERANFGMSTIVAPAYVLHLALSPRLAFFSFGMAEYVFQAAVILLLAIILRKFRRYYLFSFLTAVLYGFMLDASLAAAALLPDGLFLYRAIWYAAGLVICAAGVAFLFNTYIPPEAYELFVLELSKNTRMPLSRLKTIYDCASCLLAIILSFAFFGFGHFEGIKWGSVLCALVNGYLIGRTSNLLNRHFAFRDALNLRSFFA